MPDHPYHDRASIVQSARIVGWCLLLGFVLVAAAVVRHLCS